MSAMGLANSLMLDFRCLIVPRFIYATGDFFEGDRLADDVIQGRIEVLVEETLRLASALRPDR
jgi:FMN reductase